MNNRIIKFRAFNIKTKQMYDVRSLHNLHSQINVHADLCNDGKAGPAVISNHHSESPYSVTVPICDVCKGNKVLIKPVIE